MRESKIDFDFIPLNFKIFQFTRKESTNRISNLCSVLTDKPSKMTVLINFKKRAEEHII